MASTTKKLTPAQRKEFQKEMSALKKAGLLPAKVDVRKIQATKHYRGLARKFEGVIAGRDVAVQVPRGVGKEYGEKFSRRGDRVVVPKPQLGGKVRYDKKEKELVMRASVKGAKIKGYYKRYDEAELKKLEGDNVRFVVYIPRGGRNEVFRFMTLEELSTIFTDGSWRNFANWSEYVNVEYIENSEDEEFEETPLSYAPRVGRGANVRKSKTRRSK